MRCALISNIHQVWMMPGAALLVIIALSLPTPTQAHVGDLERAEKAVNHLVGLGHLDQAAAYARERIITTVSFEDRATLVMRLAEIQHSRGAAAEGLQLLDIAGGLTADRGKLRRIERLRRSIRRTYPELSVESEDVSPEIIDMRPDRDPAEVVQDDPDDEPPLVSASFYELNIQQALLELSFDAEVPIVWDRNVDGMVTFETYETPLDDVLTAILSPSGLGFRRVAGIYYVGSHDPKGPAFAQLSQTMVMTLSSIAADEAVGLLSSHFRPYVQATTNSNNLVTITAPTSLAERIRQDLLLIDQPPPQVLIEVMVVEVRSDFMRAHGLDWFGEKSGDPTSWLLGTSVSQSMPATFGGDIRSDGVEISGSKVDIGATLRAMVADGVAEIRASPRLTTLNGRQAQIAISQDQYYVISDPGGESLYRFSRIEAVKATIAMQITPFVGPEEMLTLVVQPQVGDVVGEGMEGLPVIFNRMANTTIRVRNGETFSIGGLNTSKVKTRNRRIPILGHIPLLGLLFRYDERSTIESEVIIFVTPHVLPT